MATAEPNPANDIDAQLADARAALRELRRAPKGETPDAARRRAGEAIRLQKQLSAAARRTVTNAVAAGAAKQTNGAAKTGGMSGLTEKQVNSILKIMAHALRPHFDTFNKRLDALEARSSLKYCGVWDPAQTYVIGDFCTDEGSLWHCSAASTGVRPGSAAGVWVLAVKRGRDARGR